MAIKLLRKKVSELRKEDSSLAYVCEYLCDYESDVNALPACDPGSTAVVIESGSVHIVNTEGNWTKFGG